MRKGLRILLGVSILSMFLLGTMAIQVGPDVYLVVGNRDLSKRWKLWRIIESDIAIKAGQSFWAALKVELQSIEGSQVKVDSVFIKVLNGYSAPGKQGEIWLEYWLYTECESDLGPCPLSSKVSSHLLYLRPDGVISDLIDIAPAIEAGKIYRIEIRNTGEIDAYFRSVELLLVVCKSTFDRTRCIE